MRCKLRARKTAPHRTIYALAVVGLAALAPLNGAQAKFKTLYTFAGKYEPHWPNGSLLRDAAGDLYGVTRTGRHGETGYGIAFKIAPDGTFTILHEFGGGDGEMPLAGLSADAAGNLYGTTSSGGGGFSCRCGTVFRIAPDGTYTVLYSFQGKEDGGDPSGGVIPDAAGNLYGTTIIFGGDCVCGTVFKLTAKGKLKTLYAFKGGADGSYPFAGLIADSQGNLYGTTTEGGGSGCDYNVGCGTAFKLAPDGTETVLHAFQGGSDGAGPLNSLTMDPDGNLFGMTELGGAYDRGTIFKILPDGSEAILHSFRGGRNDGSSPLDNGALALDTNGNLYGAATFGGIRDKGICFGSCGVVFKLDPSGALSILHRFTGDDGYRANSVIIDGEGRLYGTTFDGGGGDFAGGTVFELKN